MTAAVQTRKKKTTKKTTAKKPATKKRPGPNAGNHKLAEARRRKLYLEALARGANKSEAAGAAGISTMSVSRYRTEHPEFREQIEEAIFEHEKIRIDIVEDALFLRAVGYEYEEQRVTKDGEVVTVKLTHKPDVIAQIFFLKNRAPDRWKDVREHTMRAEVQMREEKVSHAIEKLTADKKLAGKFLPLLASVTGNGGPSGRGPSEN